MYAGLPRGSQPCSGSPLAPLAGQVQPTPQYRFRKRDKVMFSGRKITRRVTRAAGPGLLPLRGVGTSRPAPGRRAGALGLGEGLGRARLGGGIWGGGPVTA